MLVSHEGRSVNNTTLLLFECTRQDSILTMAFCLLYGNWLAISIVIMCTGAVKTLSFQTKAVQTTVVPSCKRNRKKLVRCRSFLQVSVKARAAPAKCLYLCRHSFIATDARACWLLVYEAVTVYEFLLIFKSIDSVCRWFRFISTKIVFKYCKPCFDSAHKGDPNTHM